MGGAITGVYIMARRRLVLVDGNAMVHSAWHGYPERLGPDGLSYRALHGFLSKIHRMDKAYQWDDMVVVFDPPGGSLYRKSLFSEYKAQRPEPDPDLVRQLFLIESALFDLGIKTLRVHGVESDDVLGTLAKKAAREGSMVLVVTPDKDMAQLVDDNIAILRPLRGQAAMETPFDYVDATGVFNKYGVMPSQIADWLALIGDSSDNIPGVNGVGPKKATALIEKYGDVRTLMTRADEVPGKVGQAIKESRATMETIVKLTTIQTELDDQEWEIRAASWSEEGLSRWGSLASFPYWMGRFNFLLPEESIAQEDMPHEDFPFDGPFE